MAKGWYVEYNVGSMLISRVGPFDNETKAIEHKSKIEEEYGDDINATGQVLTVVYIDGTL